MGFTKAIKSQAKARIALYGPSGSGKTLTSLRVATGMGGRIGVIDTEFGSASKYADRFNFDTLILQEHRIENYLAAIDDAKKAGIECLIIDSLSHGWETLDAENEVLAQRKFKGNSWSAWSESTPKQNALVKALLTFPGHVIGTMRSRTEWSQEKDGNGRSAPKRLGLAPIQRKGFEYEFDLFIAIDANHGATVEKDRTGKFQDKYIPMAGEEFGREVAAWLSDGAPPPPKPQETPSAKPATLFARAHAKLSDLRRAEDTAGIADWSEKVLGNFKNKQLTADEVIRLAEAYTPGCETMAACEAGKRWLKDGVLEAVAGEVDADMTARLDTLWNYLVAKLTQLKATEPEPAAV